MHLSDSATRSLQINLWYRWFQIHEAIVTAPYWSRGGTLYSSLWYLLLHIYRVSQEERTKLRGVFLMLNYTDITQNTYIQSWTVTEIMAREKSGNLAFPRTVRLQLCSALTVREHCGTHFCDSKSSAQRDKIAFHYCRCVQCLVTLRTIVTWVRVFL